MTALSQAEDKERAGKLGADRYLVKSQVTLEDVAKVAAELLGEANITPATTSDLNVATLGATPAVADPVAPATEPIAPSIPTADPVAVPEPAVVPEPVAAPSPVVAPVVADPAVSAPVAPTVPAPQPDLAELANNLQALATAMSTTPTTPAPAPTADPVAVPEPAVVPEPVAIAPEPVAAPSHVVAPVVADPVAPAPTNPVAPVLNTTVVEDATPPVSENQPEQETPPIQPLAENESTEEATPITQTTSTHTKVLTPINDINSPGPDLQALLAQEEALENASAQPPEQTPLPVAPILQPLNTAVVNDVTPPVSGSQPEQETPHSEVSISSDGTLTT